MHYISEGQTYQFNISMYKLLKQPYLLSLANYSSITPYINRKSIPMHYENRVPLKTIPEKATTKAGQVIYNRRL